MPREKKPPKPKFEKVRIEDPDGAEVYRLLDEVRHSHHGETLDLAIMLVWRLNAKPDSSGLITYGRCHLLGEIDREVWKCDVLIEINADLWKNAGDGCRRSMLDHELTHIAMVEDSEGEQKFDGRGRPLLRLRRHDITEFFEVLERWGARTELQKALVRTCRQLKLFDEAGAPSEKAETPALAPA